MPTLNETVQRLSYEIGRLAPGPLAELRRMQLAGTVVPTYWRLAAVCELPDDDNNRWMYVVKAMAIWAPRGRSPGEPAKIHDLARNLGAVFCDGGDPNWPGDNARPFISEARLARFLATPTEQRGAAFERMMRSIAAHRAPNSGVNCAEIAALFLTRDDQHILQRIARDYYRRLDRAASNLDEKDESK